VCFTQKREIKVSQNAKFSQNREINVSRKFHVIRYLLKSDESYAVNKLNKLSALKLSRFAFCFVLFCITLRSFFRIIHLRKV